MAIKTSPTKFKESIKMDFQVLLWRQWRTLGVSAFSPETTQLIDLEALILATAVAAELDQRLWESAVQWLVGFRDYVNQARLKRMSALFLKPDEHLKQPLIKKAIWNEAQHVISPTIITKKTKSNASRANRILTSPMLRKPPLLQLYLRGIFGVNARAELILYLHAKGEGNSNQIARETYYDQKNIYVILERWAESGFATKESLGKQNLYSLKNENQFLPIQSSSPPFWNWLQFFQLYSRLLIAVSTPPWVGDAYLLSSLFRDIYPQAMRIAKDSHFLLPAPQHSPGENYFAPMSNKLLALLNSLF